MKFTNNLKEILASLEPTQKELKIRQQSLELTRMGNTNTIGYGLHGFPKKGLTVTEFARRMKVSPGAVSHWIACDSGIVRSNCKKIMQKYGFRECRLTFIK